MRTTGRVRPSKPASAVAMVAGVVFVGIGLLVVIPRAGLFGILWTLAALTATGYHAFNLFSEHGVAHEVVDFDTSTSSDSRNRQSRSPEERLAELDRLRVKGLIDREEYEQQRKRILDDL